MVSKAAFRTFFERDFALTRERLAALTSELRGRSILITGGTGFFGKWLTLLLSDLSDVYNLDLKLIVMARRTSDARRDWPWIYAHPAVEMRSGDVLHMEKFELMNCDFVIHAATEASEKLNREQPRLMFEVAAMGTAKVLDFAERVGARRVLITSSGAIYGTQPPEISHLAENDYQPINPGNPGAAYAIGKLAAEYLCTTVKSEGPETVIARCFAFAGPFLPMNTHFAIGNFTLDAVEGRNIVIKGDGRPRRSYMYGADLVIWLVTLLLKGESRVAYNVGGDRSLSIAELALLVRDTCASPSGISILTAVGSSPAPQYVPNVQKARRELHLDLWTTEEESVRRMRDFERLSRA